MMAHIPTGDTCMFEFDELCGRPLAAADYIALCNAMPTIALRDVPVFGNSNRAAAYRFVTLVDVMYEHRWVQCVWGASMCVVFVPKQCMGWTAGWWHGTLSLNACWIHATALHHSE